MAISQITYATKSDINTSSAPAANKVSASDLNEIKTVVNGNANLMGDLSNLTTTDTTSLVNAINENTTDISTLVNWKLLYSTTGSTSVNVPASFTEILAIVKGNNVDLNYIPIIIPKALLSATVHGFNGGYYDGTYAWGARINGTTSWVAMALCRAGGNDYTNVSSVDYYYR